jgi:hypothetical protein
MSRGYGWVQREILEVLVQHRGPLLWTHELADVVFRCKSSRSQQESVKRALRKLRTQGRVGFEQPACMDRRWYLRAGASAPVQHSPTRTFSAISG